VQDIFLFPKTGQIVSGAHTSSNSTGATGYFPGGKASVNREADHSFPSSADFGNAWSYTPTP